MKEDIISLPHPVSPRRKRMSMQERAAQFAPFAALTGFDDRIGEEARLTDARLELDECAKGVLDARLRRIAERIREKPEASVTYFVPDAKKKGGAYITASGGVKRIDPIERLILMADGTAIPLDDVYDIRAPWLAED